jgi:hypothetical protein
VPEFDETVRDLLAKAAAAAPAYDERKLDSAAGDVSEGARRGVLTPRRPRVWFGAAAAVVVAAAGVTWWTAAQHDGGPGSASCASRLDFAGRTYVGDGALLNLPRAGDRLGVGSQPGCDDGGGQVPAETQAVYRIPGIDPATAVLTDDTVWVGSELGRLLDPIVAMNTRLPCEAPAVGTLSGRVIGYHGPAITSETSPPYTLDLAVDRGDALRLDGYAVARVRLLVTDQASGAVDAASVRQALSRQSRVTATVRCTQGRFVALTVRGEPGP